MAVVGAIVGAVAGVVGAIGQMQAADEAQKQTEIQAENLRQQEAARRQAADAQAKAMELQNKQARAEAQRRRLSAIKASRIQQGSITAAGASMGISGTPVLGALGGIQGQVASNIGFANQQFATEQARVGYIQQAQEFQNTAASFGAEAQIAGANAQAASQSGGGLGAAFGGIASGIGSLAKVF